jgi:hypothetical protein
VRVAVASNIALVGAVATACTFDHGARPKLDAAGGGDASLDARAIDASIDAMPDARVCPAAPANCQLFTCGGSPSCYYVCGFPLGAHDWFDARDACASSQIGCLATINDQAEQDCITLAAHPVYPDTVWFGFRQSASGSEPAGGWDWECGTSSYVSPAWGLFEPNNQGGSEDCGSLTTGGGWNDANCNDNSRYACELL